MYKYLRQIWVLFLLARIVCGTVRVELNDGRIVTVDDEKSITPTVDSEPGNAVVGALAPRDLFGRQTCSASGMNIICGSGCCPNTNFCCERTTCIDVSSRLCCPGGRQCLKGGDCCSDGNCCDPGKYCVKDLTTGERGCLPYAGSGGGNSNPPPAGTTARPTTTTTTRTTTRTTTAAPRSSFICRNTGYRPCPNERFCCPAGDYCYYNVNNAPRCRRDRHYTFYYTYSWSFASYGVRWYTTTTIYNLQSATVLALSTPPSPTVAPRPTGATAPVAASSPSSALSPSTTLADSTPAISDVTGTALLAGGEETTSSGPSITASSTTSQTTSSATRTSGPASSSVLAFSGGASSVVSGLMVAGWVELAMMAALCGALIVM